MSRDSLTRFIEAQNQVKPRDSAGAPVGVASSRFTPRSSLTSRDSRASHASRDSRADDQEPRLSSAKASVVEQPEL